MREDEAVNISVIFDPISKSALIHQGDRVTLLTGPFATYRDAMSAARKSLQPSRP